MGGQIAIAAAAAYPERFRRLVLMDSAGLPERIKRRWLALARMLTDSSMRQVEMYPTLIMIGMRARTAREGLRLLMKSGIVDHLPHLSLPTLVVWGAHDRVVPLSHGKHMARRIPGARLEIIHGAGHMPFYEKPLECSRIVLGFLGE